MGITIKSKETSTVYCKLFEVEKFRGFRGLIGDSETFPAKHFRSSFKLECHVGTLYEENRTVNVIYSWLFRIPLPLIRLISCVYMVGTPRSGITKTVAQAGYMCDFQLDTILQPHCLAISAKLRKRQVKRCI